MSLKTSVSDDNKTTTIRIDGRFDFNVHRDFRDAYRDINEADARVIVDLSKTEYMDSSALGMLLLLREHLGGDKANITLSGCRPEIKDILTIANFQRLFNIS